MSAPNFASAGRDYISRWEAMEITSTVMRHATTVAKIIIEHKEQYQEVETTTGVPWFWIGPIHYREADLNFKTHLANGDPLGRPTTHVPRGLLAHTWEQGAIQALDHDGEEKQKWGTFARYCYQQEAYNGWGYRGKGVTSPYLWSQSNQHERGKYVRDGVYSSTAVDEQLGTLVILKALMDLDDTITFTDL